MNDELKECPDCKRDMDLQFAGKHYCKKCKKCGKESLLSDSEISFLYDAWNTRHEPKHETVEQWEARTGETYPDDGPVWGRWDSNYRDFGHWMLITYLQAIEEYKADGNETGYFIIVANHHGKPENV